LDANGDDYISQLDMMNLREGAPELFAKKSHNDELWHELNIIVQRLKTKMTKVQESKPGND
jgi:hypothetical protein